MNKHGRERIPVLYLAPWVDYGGSDKNTIDWFRWIDRERFAPSLIATQPSPNRLLSEIEPFAEEVWALPDLMPAEDMPAFVFDFIHSRGVRVVHVMNSRMGFELLPDLGCLPDPPAVVVQLHVEEEDRSGYVRYVTTRYGNLVDGFSISNRHVADAVEGYGIPREKVRVIYTGVDVEEEFSPDQAEPIERLPEDRLQILFPARLVPQKDPLLMLDVAAALRERGTGFQIHVVGEGELEEQMRERIAALGLGEHVLLHPPVPGLQRWYAACNVLLMTSVFEGVPVVVFEAMAMGLPIVAPDLPAVGELLGEAGDALVAPRDSVEGYAAALAHLAEDREHRAERGAQMRARARQQFTVQQMAAAHGALYEELAPASAPTATKSEPLFHDPLRFDSRPRSGTPLVSVLIPHFNQARFLAECVGSVRGQNYPEIEIVVVDDASTEEAAEAALAALEGDGDVTVVRLAENGGPSRARNAGVERCSGRYILPVDSDNKLLPGAVERLVEQLSAAAEDVGFIYPNLQYFGNREDYYEVPEYNLYTLLHGNFCDTCSLLDREIFDAGERYREEIRLGHEDWEFVLRLAARGVRGEAAHGPTVLYRKWGFNRSDLVDHAGERFDELLAEISPFRGREAEVKALESPALSIIVLGGGGALAARLKAQSCGDVELLDARAGLAEAVGRARGAYLALSADPGALLEDPTLCEKALRRFVARGTENELDAIALIDAGSAGRFSFHALAAEEGPAGAAPHAVLWRRTAELSLPQGLLFDPADPVASLVRLLCGAGLKVEWRHAPGEGGAGSGAPDPSWEPLPASPASAKDPHNLNPGAQPLLLGAGEYRVPRWEDVPTWVPPLSTIAIRYREPHGPQRLATNRPAPVGFLPEHHLGAPRSVSFEGTARVVRNGEEYEAISAGEQRPLPDGAEEIGYVELAGFPQMDTLALAVHRESGQQVLVSLPDDPILHEVDLIGALGHIEPFPARPRQSPDCAKRPLGLLGLTRALDLRRRRHRYAIGAVAEGELLAELGGLAESPLGGAIGAWIVDGYLVTERHRPSRSRPGSVDVARWAAEPARWRGMARPATSAKVALSRAATSAARLARPARPVAAPEGDPEAWLFESERPGRTPLFAAYHPVTGDQLLARSTEDVAQLGYGKPELLGYLRRVAPVTGEILPRPLPIPWARRFGAVPQTG
jgi:glycosyltransferase involved in cell wall biosynthesis